MPEIMARSFDATHNKWARIQLKTGTGRKISPIASVINHYWLIFGGSVDIKRNLRNILYSYFLDYHKLVLAIFSTRYFAELTH